MTVRSHLVLTLALALAAGTACGKSRHKENKMNDKASGAAAPVPGAYRMEKVTFQSGGLPVVGNLFLPAGGAAKKPALAILGPVAFVKEQSPVQYATRLARLGFVALAFDPRFHGESGGEPRRLESGTKKAEDLKAAFDFLASRPEVDAGRLHMLGVCQGVNWAIEETLADDRIRSLAVVAGHYLTPATAEKYLGSKEAVAARIRKGRAAREKFEKTGAADYIPIIGDSPDALLLPKPIHQWYERWAHRGPAWGFQGGWENRITALSEEVIWGHRVDESLQMVKKPTLMVHADNAASGPEIPKKLFESIPAADKKLVWLGKQVQFQFYEEPVTIDLAVNAIAAWFGGH